MKALSLKQPWLWAITEEDKRVENRTWKPMDWIIGKRIALHASKNDDPGGVVAIFNILGAELPHNLPRGAIVATAKIIGWVDERNGTFKGPSPCLGHYVDDKWFFGPIGWILDDVKKLEVPVPCRGHLGLWDIPGDLMAYVTGQDVYKPIWERTEGERYSR